MTRDELTAVTKQKPTPGRAAPLLGARSTYSGAAKSTVYKHKAKYRAASAGCARVDSFFRPRAPSPPLANLIAPPDLPSDGRVTVEQPPSVIQAPTTDLEGPVEHGAQAAVFLDPAGDEIEEGGSMEDSVRLRLEKLIKMAKKHKSAAALFKLHTLKMYLELYAKMKLNPRISNPAQRASLSIARSVGRGAYFARQLRHLKLYVHRFGTLPPSRTGKHHAHPSLLNNEHIAVAVRRYLTVLADGEVSLLQTLQQLKTHRLSADHTIKVNETS